MSEKALIEAIVDALLEGLESGLEKAKGIRETWKKIPVFVKAEIEKEPRLESLPWKSYKTKQAAKPDEAAWIFANTKGAEVLLAQLKTKGKVSMGGFEYRLKQGRDRQFITRKPLK